MDVEPARPYTFFHGYLLLGYIVGVRANQEAGNPSRGDATR